MFLVLGQVFLGLRIVLLSLGQVFLFKDKCFKGYDKPF